MRVMQLPSASKMWRAARILIGSLSFVLNLVLLSDDLRAGNFVPGQSDLHQGTHWAEEEGSSSDSARVGRPTLQYQPTWNDSLSDPLAWSAFSAGVMRPGNNNAAPAIDRRVELLEEPSGQRCPASALPSSAEDATQFVRGNMYDLSTVLHPSTISGRIDLSQLSQDGPLFGTYVGTGVERCISSGLLVVERMYFDRPIERLVKEAMFARYSFPLAHRFDLEFGAGWTESEVTGMHQFGRIARQFTF